VANATAADLGLMIAARAEQLHQVRVWRRWTAVATLIDFAAIGAGTLVVLAQLARLDVLGFIPGLLVATAAFVVVAGIARGAPEQPSATQALRVSSVTPVARRSADAHSPRGRLSADERLFLAGLMAGIAGSAFIGLVEISASGETKVKALGLVSLFALAYAVSLLRRPRILIATLDGVATAMLVASLAYGAASLAVALQDGCRFCPDALGPISAGLPYVLFGVGALALRWTLSWIGRSG
jgi:hypothetical protein